MGSAERPFGAGVRFAMCLSCSFFLRIGHHLCRKYTRPVPAKHVCDAMRIVPEYRNGRGLGLAVLITSAQALHATCTVNESTIASARFCGLLPPLRAPVALLTSKVDNLLFHSCAGNRVLSNHQIVVIAVYLIGGDSQRVDTEDVAVKASEIAPGRFTWRKYPQQINIETVRKRLWDACKPEKGGYVLGSEKDGWLLTEAGVKFARKEFGAAPGSKKRVSARERAWLKSERERLFSSDAFLKHAQDGDAVITKREAESFFRIDNYVQGEARERKLLRVLNAFGDDSELGPTVRKLAAIVRGG